MHPDSRLSAVACLEVTDGRIVAGFLSCRLDAAGRVRAVDPRSDDGQPVLDLVERSCASVGLSTDFTIDEQFIIDGVPVVRLPGT
jgi:hypothetical protein